jgi:hypothetical protein
MSDDLVTRLRVEPTASHFLKPAHLYQDLIAERAEAANRIEADAKLIQEMVINTGDFLQKLGTMQAAMKDGINVHGALSEFVAAEESLLETMERIAKSQQEGETE